GARPDQDGGRRARARGARDPEGAPRPRREAPEEPHAVREEHDLHGRRARPLRARRRPLRGVREGLHLLRAQARAADRLGDRLRPGAERVRRRRHARAARARGRRRLAHPPPAPGAPQAPPETPRGRRRPSDPRARLNHSTRETLPSPRSAKPNGELSDEGNASLAPFGKAERGPTPCGVAALAGWGLPVLRSAHSQEGPFAKEVLSMARGLDSSVAPFPASARRSASRSGALAFALVVAATALLLAPGRASAQRQSGIQQGFEDEFTVLVSKDLGDQRWSIHYDGFVASGIVYPQAGGAPQFVWCENVSEEDPADPILFD